MPAKGNKIPHIPWNEDLETLLLHCVIVKGAHLCAGTKNVTQLWNEVNEMFYEQELTQDLKSIHYQEGNVRKLRDKYSNVLDAVSENIATGNQSGKDGELSLLFQHVQSILDNIEEKDAKKEARAALAEKLNEDEKKVLEKGGPLKRKRLDGKITDITSGTHKTPKNFVDQLLEIVKTVNDDDSSKAGAKSAEDFELKFAKWVEAHFMELSDLLERGAVAARFHSDVEEIGLKTLLSIYCTNVNARSMKEELRDTGLPMIVCSKIYMALQEWRRECELWQETEEDNVTVSSSTSLESLPSVSSLGMSSVSK